MRRPALKNPFKRSPAGTAAPAASKLADNQPFDLAELEYEAKYRRQRRLGWRRAVLAALGLMLLAGWCLQPGWLTGHAIGDYNHAHYATARRWLWPLTWASPQPFVMAFNSGTIDTRQQHYDAAQRELTRALALAPAAKRCMVLQNLVYALEAQAAGLQKQGNKRDATVYTTQATSYRTSNQKCFPSSGSQQQKQTGAGGGGGSSAAQDQQSASQSAAQTPSPAQQQQLQQKEQQGQQQQLQDGQQDEVNLNNPNVKQW